MRIITLALAFVIITTSHVQAQADISVGIAQNFDRMEHALNNANQPLEKINILHDMIKDDATIKVKVNNPVLSPSENAAELTLDKEAYINSFVIGGRYVNNYNAEIQTLAVKAADNKDEAVSVITLKETGAILDPHNLEKRGKLFISTTQCQSIHGANLQITSSNCKTDVSFVSEI